MEGSKMGLLGRGMEAASMCIQRHLEELLRPRSIK